jgi:hypothetical protein
MEGGPRNYDGPWQQLLKKKYHQKQTLTQDENKVGISQFWSVLMKVKHVLYGICDGIVVSGEKARLWEDCWHGKQLWLRNSIGCII